MSIHFSLTRGPQCVLTAHCLFARRCPIHSLHVSTLQKSNWVNIQQGLFLNNVLCVFWYDCSSLIMLAVLLRNTYYYCLSSINMQSNCRVWKKKQSWFYDLWQLYKHSLANAKQMSNLKSVSDQKMMDLLYFIAFSNNKQKMLFVKWCSVSILSILLCRRSSQRFISGSFLYWNLIDKTPGGLSWGSISEVIRVTLT